MGNRDTVVRIGQVWEYNYSPGPTSPVRSERFTFTRFHDLKNGTFRAYGLTEDKTFEEEFGTIDAVYNKPMSDWEGWKLVSEKTTRKIVKANSIPDGSMYITVGFTYIVMDESPSGYMVMTSRGTFWYDMLHFEVFLGGTQTAPIVVKVVVDESAEWKFFAGVVPGNCKCNIPKIQCSYHKGS